MATLPVLSLFRRDDAGTAVPSQLDVSKISDRRVGSLTTLAGWHFDRAGRWKITGFSPRTQEAMTNRSSLAMLWTPLLLEEMLA